MHAFEAVEDLDGVSDGAAGACFRGEALQVIHLVLERREEDLVDGFVPTHC